MAAKVSKGEEAFWLLVRAHPEWPEVIREYMFAKPRRWRFDFAIPTLGIAIEVEGGTMFRSRHTSGDGFEADCEKYNCAAIIGWKLLRFTTRQVVKEPGWVIECVERAIQGSMEHP